MEHGSVIMIGETIASIEEKNTSVADAIEIDAEGKYISRGFIDIQVHGGGGHDFMDGNETLF